jgi:hypothetical protein
MPSYPRFRRAYRALVQTSEYCLYALLVIQPTIGFGAVLTRGRSFTLFWGQCHRWYRIILQLKRRYFPCIGSVHGRWVF